ncbi:putative metal-dependent hydrolase [Desulfitobacterium dichloroeliminans LMG P-21439]|uniref:Putative metal-dependent hydrolase n=1 Tax=Desulfitobacterium dichloroeliminans (strain LMG P-21439 / DCA1) TaxID=871963 RepID=L0F435_DESDL|nr:SprT family zinc-dependent metalloprotease [Desulfitobacterium dichloroeliminans]AGA67932.1 putative metal-dependent hydrolase [Desulfitobacterium dichloroeliminans LMG P-21439]
MPSLKLGNTVIPYEERRSRRIKRISIRVTPEKVRVSAPARTSKSEIQAFIDKNRDWIIQNWTKLQETMVKPQRVYETGEKIPFVGKELTLEIMDTPQKMIRALYKKENEVLEIKIPQELQGEQRQEALREIIEKWYKQKARTVFLQKLNNWSQQMGVSYNQFRLKEQKTRWGSCSSLGNINLNWRAIMAPEPVLDYLVIHELSHLRHMDHSSEFWENVACYCPEHALHRRWLKEKGHGLVI